MWLMKMDRTEKTGRSGWLMATPFLPSDEPEVLSLSLFLGCQSVSLSILSRTRP